MNFNLPASDCTAPSPISDRIAYAIVASVVTIGIFSAVVPAISDAAIGVLVIIGAALLWRHRWGRLKPVIVLALAWMLFVAFSAAWATYSGSPGNQFRSWSKFAPIALGPMIALALAAASRRLKWPMDRWLALFLAGLILGALIQLVRNDAAGVVWHLRSVNGQLGSINRNLAALLCSLAIVASLSLIHYGLFEPRVRSIAAVLTSAVLCFVLTNLLVLLVLLHSRNGYIGTAAGLIAWVMVIATPSSHGRKGSHRLRLAAVLVAVAALAFAAYGMLLISERTLIGVPAGGWLELAGLILQGRFDQAYALAQTGEERLQLLTLAADLFHRRPWLGWGPDVWLLIHDYSPLERLRDLNQFHNGYAQFLVNFGIAGVLMMGAYLLTLIRTALRRSGLATTQMSSSMFAGSVGLLVLLLVENASESVLLVKSAASVAMMLAVMACLPAANEVLNDAAEKEVSIPSNG